MKILFSLIIIYSSQVFAQTFVDISGLYSSTENPAFSSFLEKFEMAKEELKNEKLTSEQEATLAKVSKEFATKATEATAKAKRPKQQ